MTDDWEWHTDLSIGEFYAPEIKLGFYVVADGLEVHVMRLERWDLGAMPMSRDDLVKCITAKGVQALEDRAVEAWQEMERAGLNYNPGMAAE